MRNLFNLNLYPTQISAIKKLRKGNIVNVETGEGKTIIIAILAVMNALDGKEVVVITPNEYLNIRDYELCNRLAEVFNLTCSLNKVMNAVDQNSKDKIFNSNIVYSSCSEFIFDYLRGKSNKYFVKKLLNKTVIIDEIDQVLIDNSNTNYSISVTSTDIDEDELALYLLARDMCKFFVGGELNCSLVNSNIRESDDYDFIFNRLEYFLFMTERGNRKLSNLLGLDLKDKLNLPIISAVHNTLLANHVFEKGIDYIVKGDGISIIDKNNGRYKENNHYSSGINLALEIKEGCSISKIPDNEYSVNGLFFFSQFENLVGCSGTAFECRNIFRRILNISVKKVPRNRKMDINLTEPKYFLTEREKYEKTTELVKELSSNGLPVLVIAENDNICKDFNNFISKELPTSKILTNENLEEEENIIKYSGEGQSVLVSTLISGRGTDIIVDKRVSDLGGLQVIFLTRFANVRAEKQIIGRTGRQGNKGCVHYMSSLEDPIFNHLALKNKTKIYRYFIDNKTNKINSQIKRLQSLHARKLDSNILNLYRKNYILNLYENYLMEMGIENVADFLFEIEYFILGYNLSEFQSFSRCVVEIKGFVDSMLKEGYHEYNVKSSL